MTPFKAYHAHIQTRVAAALEAALPVVQGEDDTLFQAMRYAVLGGGKRLRALLVYATGQLFDVPEVALDDLAVSVELIHAYSLIHDDLPAMDDDALRRGQPTCHVKYGEATAILAGDALQALAFERLCAATQFTPEQRVNMVQLLSTAIGAEGMCGGQMLDLKATGQRLTADQLAHMHELKTGYLIQASILLGALASTALSAEDKAHLSEFGRLIGMAFQVQDDILDVEIETHALGKTQGADAARGKATYPSVLGMSEAKTLVGDVLSKALGALKHVTQFKTDAHLWHAAHFMVQRQF